MKRALSFIELLRPQQWIKNAFVLVGLVFGHAWGDPALVRAALSAAFAFCRASGAVFTNSGSRDDISAIARRQTSAGERENGQIVQRRAARGG